MGFRNLAPADVTHLEWNGVNPVVALNVVDAVTAHLQG